MVLLYVYVACLVGGGVLLGGSLLLGGRSDHDAGAGGGGDLDGDADLHVGELEADVDADADLPVGELEADVDADADLHVGGELEAHVDGEVELHGGDADFHAGDAEVHGGELELHHGADLEAHADGCDHALAETEVGAGGDLVLSDLWLPFVSLRFWIFCLAFFGLTGTALSLLALAGSALTLALSSVVGVTTGFAAAFIVQRLRRLEVGRVTEEEEFRGLEGQVIVPANDDGCGKIRVELKGQRVDLMARADEAGVLERGRTVLIVEMKEGVALVVRPPT